jgi:hypothetical protein
MNETPSTPITPEPTKQPWIAPQLKKLDLQDTESNSGTGSDADFLGIS